MLIRVIDFETTGLEPPPADAVVEIGWCDVRLTDAGAELGVPYAVIVDPGRPIPPVAMSIHHITDEIVVTHGIPWDDALLMLQAGSPDIFCAHMAKFEQQFFPTDKPWICTWKCAQRIWPEAPAHSNQALRYWLSLQVDDALAMPPHRSGPDSYITARVLQRMLDDVLPADAVAWTLQPVLLTTVTFGKHRGVEWINVPLDYLQWIVNQAEMDLDVVHTARHYLNQARRRSGHQAYDSR